MLIYLSYGPLGHRDFDSRDYVLFYIADNTPMLYLKVSQSSDVVLLEVDLKVADFPGVCFTDGNLASNSTRIYHEPNDLEKLNWKILMSRQAAYGSEWKNARMAEVLVPQACPPDFVRIIHIKQDYLDADSLNQQISEIVKTFPERKIRILKDLSANGVS
jgi:hypothetical protein